MIVLFLRKTITILIFYLFAETAQDTSRVVLSNSFDILTRVASYNYKTPKLRITGSTSYWILCKTPILTELRGGYKESDILKRYILVANKAREIDGNGSALRDAALGMPVDVDAMYHYGIFLLDKQKNRSGAEYFFK